MGVLQGELAALVSELIAQRDDPQSFLEIFASHGWDQDRLLAETPGETAEPYSRRVIAATPECEIMLANWQPNHPCAPHDHGQSAGWVFFLDCPFYEISYHWQGGQLHPGERRSILPGSVLQVVKKEIHSCCCQGRGRSLHIYFPAIQGMRVFDCERRRTLTVSDNCGAWVPEPEQIVREEPWKTTPASPAAL